ncbi:MAG: electron transport complex subunit RsxE [Candidatus Woesearchaeota archaeon]
MTLKDLFNDFSKGIFKQNPIFIAVLGLCPTLAITTGIDNAIGMGAAVTFVLLMSAIFVSAVRKIMPANVRIPSFIVIIASFVTIVQLVMKAYLPALDRALGIFVPLIVVNCIIMGRAEAFSSKNNIGRSMLDALGVGIGFFLAIFLISGVREFLGTGGISVFGTTIIAPGALFNPAIIFILAPGALLTMGLLMALFNAISDLVKNKKKIKLNKLKLSKEKSNKSKLNNLKSENIESDNELNNLKSDNLKSDSLKSNEALKEVSS